MSLIEAKKKLLMAQKGGGLKPQDVFNTSLWTGTDAARTITTGIDSGEGALVWIKERSSDYQHTLGDTVRGVSNFIATDSTAESQSVPSGIAGVTPTGYTLGTWVQVNQSGRNFVGWQFRRAEKFFDIVTYTGNGVAGRTIAHSLGVVPGMMIVKQTDTTRNWAVYHTSIGATQYAYLNSTNAFSSSAVRWDNTNPTTSVFTVGTSAETNSSGGTYVAYLFAHDPDPTGIIQCGSYVGNGSSTGPVVNLGWRPQYLMIKAATFARSWTILDQVRGMNSGTNAFLFANLSNAEGNGSGLITTTTGFTPNSTSADLNSSGQTYIYMAIREPI